MEKRDIVFLSDSDLAELYEQRRSVALAEREKVRRGEKPAPFISVEAQQELVDLRDEIDRRSRLPEREVDFTKYLTQ